MLLWFSFLGVLLLDGILARGGGRAALVKARRLGVWVVWAAWEGGAVVGGG